MKTFTLFWFFTCSAVFVQAQSGPINPDTLLQEFFYEDPTPFMLPAPTGEDVNWINYDVDGLPSQCTAENPSPQAWYWESDLGYANPDETDNFAFTSCSFLDVPTPQSQNRNWLITTQITIPDSTYALSWRSLAFQGPMFLDGYKVLLSTHSNDPASGDFTDTLFRAAQMISPVGAIGSLNLGAYNFSEGYIQAAGYTDTSYFFLDTTTPNKPFYRGRLEPHMVSLEEYAGESVYLAFLHDSDDDNLIQVDDIVVSNTFSVGTNAPSGIRAFRLLGNPTGQSVYFSWSLETAQEAHLVIFNTTGRLMLEKTFVRQQETTWHTDIRQWEPGIYYCTLQTQTGRSTVRLVKI